MGTDIEEATCSTPAPQVWSACRSIAPWAERFSSRVLPPPAHGGQMGRSASAHHQQGKPAHARNKDRRPSGALHRQTARLRLGWPADTEVIAKAAFELMSLVGLSADQEPRTLCGSMERQEHFDDARYCLSTGAQWQGGELPELCGGLPVATAGGVRRHCRTATLNRRTAVSPLV